MIEETKKKLINSGSRSGKGSGKKNPAEAFNGVTVNLKSDQFGHQHRIEDGR